MMSRKFGHFLTPFPHRHAFYNQGLSAVVTKSLTPSPKGRDVIYGWPLLTVIVITEFDCVWYEMLYRTSSLESRNIILERWFLAFQHSFVKQMWSDLRKVFFTPDKNNIYWVTSILWQKINWLNKGQLAWQSNQRYVLLVAKLIQYVTMIRLSWS